MPYSIKPSVEKSVDNLKVNHVSEPHLITVGFVAAAKSRTKKSNNEVARLIVTH